MQKLFLNAEAHDEGLVGIDIVVPGYERVGWVEVKHDGDKLSIEVCRVDESYAGPVEVTVR